MFPRPTNPKVLDLESGAMVPKQDRGRGKRVLRSESNLSRLWDLMSSLSND